MNWESLEECLKLAKCAGVSFSLHYEEPADSWYGEVSSAAKNENWIGKSRSFDTAIADLIEFLDSL